MTTASLPPAARRALPRLLTLLLCLGLAGPAAAAEVRTLTRSETPRMLSGDSDSEFVVGGPFSLAWQSAGGAVSVEVTAEGAERPTAAGATQGKGGGRMKLRGEQHYRVLVTAEGAWTVWVSW